MHLERRHLWFPDRNKSISCLYIAPRNVHVEINALYYFALVSLGFYLKLYCYCLKTTPTPKIWGNDHAKFSISDINYYFPKTFGEVDVLFPSLNYQLFVIQLVQNHNKL